MKRTTFVASLLLVVLAAVPLHAAAYSESAYYAEASYYSQSYYQAAYASGSGGAANRDYQVITYTGGAQSFTVPNGVTSLNVVVVGGGGGGGGGAAGWGSAAGGGCGGGVKGQTLSVTPGQVISVTVGAGGAGGPSHAVSGNAGGSTSFGAISAAGGGAGRHGYYNLYNQYAGGSGGGSGGGGGGNGWPGFYGLNAPGGKGGYMAPNNSQTSGGYCIGAAWDGSLSSLITAVSFATGDGGYAPGGYQYWGGGGGGGLVINGSAVNGGQGTYNQNNGGKGYGAGGGGAHHDGPLGGAGAPGVVYVEWAAYPASCSVSFSQNPINVSDSATLSWTVSNVNPGVNDDTLYIDNVGYVTGTSGSFSVTPATTTNYRCYADGIGGSDGWHDATLTVRPLPSVTLSSSDAEITRGESVTISWSATNANSCTSSSFDTGGSSSGSVSVSPDETTVYAINCTGDGGTASASTTVTVSHDPCVLDGVTIQHGESRTYYSTQTAPPGQTCTGSGGGTNYSQTRTCTDGTLSGSASYQYASCTCAATYSCSGNTVTYTNTSCSTTSVTSCASPFYCSPGVSSCVSPEPQFDGFGAGFSGHLEARPLLVPRGLTTRLYWNVSNVEGCTVTGDNGDSWTGLTSGASGKVTLPLTARTIFTLSCDAYEGASFSDESATVNLVPVFNEN